MAKRVNGLSHDLIIHPGETLKEVIDERELSQKELAVRTGLSPKHISDVVNCIKPISVNCAKKLEYALDIDASFWVNLQANYDRELADYEEFNHISEGEIRIVKKLKSIIIYLTELGFIEKSSDQNNVINLRKLLKISCLENIPKVAATGAYRIAESSTVDPYVLFSWIRISELITNRQEDRAELNIELLMEIIPKIKRTMFDNSNEIQQKLQKIFIACGIKFAIAKNFRGAPVQGIITKISDRGISLILTFRQKYADIFWFTLFHEIGHIVNDDIKRRLIDYSNKKDPIEFAADEFASGVLIETIQYELFLKNGDFSLESINTIAKLNNVKPYIVIGRLQRDKIIGYNVYSSEKEKYEWKLV